MKKLIAVAALALAPLAACSQSVEDAQEDATEAKSDMVAAQADVAEAVGDDATAERLDAKAEAISDGGDTVDVSATPMATGGAMDPAPAVTASPKM